MQTKRTPWVHAADKPEWANSKVSAYRIWMQTDGRRFWQRHEWLMRNGSVDLCDWIDAHTNTFPAHYEEVPSEELIAA